MRFLNKKSGQFVTIHPRNTQGVCALLRNDEYLVIKNDDGEHWITLTPSGEHVLINGEGKIMAGAGDKLNGKQLKDVKSKSKNVEKHGAPNPQFPPKSIETPKESEFQKNHKEFIDLMQKDLLNQNDPEKLRETVTKVNNFIVDKKNDPNLSDEEKEKLNELRNIRMQLTKKFLEIEQKEANNRAKEIKEKSKNESKDVLSFNESNQSFMKKNIEDIQKEFKEKFNTDVALGENKAKRKALWEEATKYRLAGEFEKSEEKRKEYYALGKAVGARVRSHTPVDITANTKTAKQQRMIIGKVADAYEDLTKRGWDIKNALGSGKVAYTPAGVGKNCGHAFQQDGVGYYSISHGKYFDPKYLAEAKLGRERREKANKPRWTVGMGTEYEMQATIIHEMTHALGMQKHIDSPAKLQGLFKKLASDGKFTGFPTEKPDMHEFSRMKEWIKWNISEYASTNFLETDAELATLVTSPDYVRGTLPKELEDHVDDLLKRKN